MSLINDDRRQALRVHVAWTILSGYDELLSNDSGISLEDLIKFVHFNEISEDNLNILDVLADL